MRMILEDYLCRAVTKGKWGEFAQNRVDKSLRILRDGLQLKFMACGRQMMQKHENVKNRQK